MPHSDARVLLLGAGHAHLEVIRQAAPLLRAGARMTAVAPPEFWYSGRATAALAGRIPESLNRLDVAALCRSRGVDFVDGQVVGGDPGRKEIHLADGRRIPYTILSVNLGSVVPTTAPGLGEVAVPARPIPGLLDLGQSLAQDGDRNTPDHVVVVGAGPTGCEIALALRQRGGTSLRITIVSPQAPLAGLSRWASRSMLGVLERARIEHVGENVVGVRHGAVEVASGARLPCTHMVNSTGLVPNPVAARLGLPVHPDGAIRLTEHLEVPGHPGHFGAGDAVRVEGTHPPPAGVWAVRQAPVLVHNLLARITGGPLKSFGLNRPVLLILALGDGTALATFGPLAARGSWALRWKDRLDERWLARYRVAESAPTARSPA